MINMLNSCIITSNILLNIIIDMLLRLSNICASTGTKDLFENVSFVVNKGDRLGLIGPNGCGKSTLFRIILDEVQPDQGEIQTSPNIRINYLPQLISDEYANECLKRLASSYEDENLNRTYYSEVMTALDLWDIIETDAAILSGGQKTKIAIACALVFSADLLILDEPTNFLDLKSVIWLEDFLQRIDCAIITVSHDRAYLDNVAEGILALSEKGVKFYKGGYTDFTEAVEHETEHHYNMYRVQKGVRERLEADITSTKDQASRTENSTKNDVLRRYAKKVAKKAKSRETRLTKMLLSSDWVGKPYERPTVYVEFDETPKKGTLVRCEDLSFSYGKDDHIIQSASLTVSGGEKIALLGANGSGKTTFLRLIVSELDPKSGKIWRNESAVIGYFSQNLKELDPKLNVLDAVRKGITSTEEETRQVLGGLLIRQNQISQKVGTLSQGEKTKVGIARQILKKPDLLVLDEFTSHLDLDAIEQIQEAITEYRGAVLFVTHDRYILESINIDHYYHIGDGKTKELLSGMQEYKEMIA